MQTTFTIAGMTCEHCEKRVAGEVGEVIGVESVTADHVTGLMSVTSASAPDPEAVREAVEEAGYTVVDG